MTENMKRFLALISSNEELAARLNGASTAETIAIASELGVALTGADFEAAVEVSDDDLDAVSGGGEGRPICFLNGSFTRRPGKSRS